jgi:phytoene dehydrogenase-like protein
VRQAVLTMATVIFHRHPEEASVGRLAEFLRRPRGGGPFLADDEEVGGMQGLVEPFARALRARGGEIALGWKPVEIVVEDGRARGVVAVDRANLVREVRAPIVVSTYPAWENLPLLDPARVPDTFRRQAEALRAHRADLVGWQAGLRRLPIVRATGDVEAHDGWNRLLAGPERAYRGGFQITSLGSRRAAPAGKHLLSLVIVRWFRGGESAGQPWPAARRELEEAIAYLERFYADLSACVEWSRFQYVTAPQSMSWAWAPLARHGLEVDGLTGLLLAGSTIESPAGVVDVGAWAGLEAARRALALLGAR